MRIECSSTAELLGSKITVFRYLGMAGALIAVLGGGSEVSLVGCAVASISIAGLSYLDSTKEGKLNETCESN